MNTTDLSEFKKWNKWGGDPPENRDSLLIRGQTFKLRVPVDAPETYGDELALAAAKVLPPVSCGPHLKYRIAVVDKFQENETEPPKLKKGKQFRNEEESRLDRAFTQVAEAYDRCEPTIRDACTRAYDGESPTEQFRQDCAEIMNRTS